MAKKVGPARFIVTAAIFIILEVAAVAMLHSSSVLQNIWINRASRRVMASLWSGEESVRGLFSLRDVNRELADENFRLKEELRGFRLAEDAARRDSLVRSIEADDAYSYMPASIVKVSRNTAHNYIILDKGSEDGVVPHSGIISDKGVVGIIEAVDRHYSYGLTLMNANVSIGARISGLGIVSPLVWDGVHSNRGLLKDIPSHYEINPGDTVRTSGYSTIFPPDLPVGVTRNVQLIDGSTYQVGVDLFQDFATLRFVTIVQNTRRDEIEDLENKEKEKQ